MKKLLPLFLLLALCAGALSSCSEDDEESTNYWTRYKAWREVNNDYFQRMRDTLDADGRPYYRVIYPAWNPAAEVLIHYYNDRAETEGNLTPLYTSTVDVRYIGRLYNQQAFDSSYTQTAYGPGIARLVPQNLVNGWAIALENMRVGDTARIVIPYTLGYGAQMGGGGSILPYSALQFDLRLVDIAAWEVQP